MRLLEDLYVQSLREEANKANPVAREGLTATEANGETWNRGRLQGLQEAAMNILQVRFPILAATPQAQQAIASFQNTELFDLLHRVLLVLPDERAVRTLLELRLIETASDRANSELEAIGEAYIQSPHEKIIREMIEDDPVVQELLTEAYDRAYNEAWTRGKLRGLRKSVLNFLRVQFPVLAATPQAQQAVASIENADTLEQLFKQMLQVPDEQTARIVLGLPSE